MGLIDAMVYKMWSWMNSHKTAYAAHIANASAHHVKYTDAEAVTAVAAADDYVKNTGDTITGTLVSTKTGAGGGFDVQDEFNIFRFKSGGQYGGYYVKKFDSTTVAWFGGKSDASGYGELQYYVYYGGGSARINLIINYNYVKISRPLFLENMKSGATQAGAGATANEVWKTSSHASLPDNVLMIGV